MDRNTIFTDEEDEQLINFVSLHPILFDLSEKDYKNRPKQDKVWSEIGEILSKSGDDCRKRWKNIKDTYFRQKRKSKCGTGSAAPKNPRSKFNTYANLLSFLETAPTERLTISNVENDVLTREETQMSEELNVSSGLHNEEQMENAMEISKDPLGSAANKSCTNTAPVTDTSSSNSQSSAIKFPKSTKRQKKNDILDYLKKREESRQKALDKLSDDEELVSFSDHLKSVLKKLPPILKIKAKNELYGVLTKYELLSLEQSPSHTFSSASSPYSPGYILPETLGDYSPEQNTTTNAPAAPSTSVQYSNSANFNSVQIFPSNILQSTTDIHQIYSPISEANTEVYVQEHEATDLSLIHFEELE